MLPEIRSIRTQSILFVTLPHSSRWLFALLVTALFGGCSNPKVPSLEALPGPSDLPFLHKIDIQQGNVLTQDMVGQLQRGMDKKKVVFVMGTPIIKDTFNTHRWDYIYTFMPGGGEVERRSLTLVFTDDKLDYVEGDIVPAAGELIVDTHQDMSVEVPLYFRKNLLGRLKDKIPFTGDDEEEYIYDIDDAGKLDDKKSDDTDGEKSEDGEAQNDEPTQEQDAEEDQEDDQEDTQVASATEELVPRDAPTGKKKRGFFRRIFDGIGLGAKDDEDVAPGDHDPSDPKYRDITNPDDL